MKIFGMLLPVVLRLVKSFGTTALSPVLEKNLVKRVGAGSPLVFSMSRLIAVAFAAVAVRQFWHDGIVTWPQAALGIATVLALPVMSSIEQADPDQVVALTRVLLSRLGPTEPSKFDDHRDD